MSSKERDQQRIAGHSFWQVESPSQPRPIELNSRDELELDHTRTSWTVHGLVGEPYSLTIDSASPIARAFLRRVVAAKQAIARRHATVSPVFKPEKRRESLSLDQPFVSCPFCRPHETGEALPDCEICGGEGTISAEDAARWHELID